MTKEYETAFENTLASLDQMGNSLDGMRATEAVFCLERVISKTREVIADLQCDTPLRERN